MTTFIKILQHHHKFLLENHQKIINCQYYKDAHVDLLFHTKKFKLLQLNLGDLLHIWKNTVAHINNSKVFIVSIRESSKKLSGTGINIITGEVEVGELTLDRSVDSFFTEYNIARDFFKYYVPLPHLIVEFQTGNTEYHHYVEELTNIFFTRLQLKATLEKYNLGNKVKLIQTQDIFYLTINSGFLLDELLNSITEVNFKNKNSLRDKIRQTCRERGYVNEIFPDRFVISKFFDHPRDLLKDATIKDIIGAAKDFEEIIQDFMREKL